MAREEKNQGGGTEERYGVGTKEGSKKKKGG